MDARGPSYSLGLPLVLGFLYLAFAVLLYVRQPLLLGLFCTALFLIWLQAAAQRCLRRFMPRRAGDSV